MSIQLDRETSVEAALFKTFAEFLSKIEKMNEKKDVYKEILRTHRYRISERYIFYCYIGNDLFSGLGARTVENFILGKAGIDDERFKFFCSRFSQVYADLSLEDQNEYKGLNLAFVEWKNRIFKRYNWEIEEVHENSQSDIPTEISIEELEPVKNNLTEKEEFRNALSILDKYYDRDRERFYIEEIYFNLLRSAVHKREFREPTSSLQPSGSVLRRLRLALKIMNYEWELFELKDNIVINRSVSF